MGHATNASRSSAATGLDVGHGRRADPVPGRTSVALRLPLVGQETAKAVRLRLDALLARQASKQHPTVRVVDVGVLAVPHGLAGVLEGLEAVLPGDVPAVPGVVASVQPNVAYQATVQVPSAVGAWRRLRPGRVPEDTSPNEAVASRPSSSGQAVAPVAEVRTAVPEARPRNGPPRLVDAGPDDAKAPASVHALGRVGPTGPLTGSGRLGRLQASVLPTRLVVRVVRNALTNLRPFARRPGAADEVPIHDDERAEEAPAAEPGRPRPSAAVVAACGAGRKDGAGRASGAEATVAALLLGLAAGAS